MNQPGGPSRLAALQLVLGSGGPRTFSYVGAIEELESRGYRFSSVCGVSAGAMIAVLVAAGLSGEVMRRRLLALDFAMLEREYRRYDRARRIGELWRLWRPYTRFSRSVTREFMLRLLDPAGEPTLADLELPFASVGLDLVTERMFVYSQRSEPRMKVADVVAIATAALPWMPPVERGGRLLVDGVLVSECPVWLAGVHRLTDPVLACKCSLPSPGTSPTGPLDTLRRAITAGIRGGDQAVFDSFENAAEISFDVPDRVFWKLTRNDAELMIDEGRRQMKTALDRGLTFDAAPESGLDANDAASAARFFSSRLAVRRDRVFISYSRQDGALLSELGTALDERLANAPAIQRWSDRQISAGSEWYEELDRAMDAARVAVLLVSRSYRSSSFIPENEETPLVRRAKAGLVTLLWINVDLPDLDAVPERLRDFQAIHRGEPLPADPAARGAVWDELAGEIQRAFG